MVLKLQGSYHGYSILVCTTEDDPDVERECLNRLRNGFVDGIIIAGTGKCGRLIRDIHTSGISVIQIIRKQELHLSSVIANYKQSAYRAVKYLAEKGCKEIGLINGPMSLSTYYERYQGYKKAISELGLKEICPESTQQANTFEYGFQCAESLLTNYFELDAIITSVDIQGIGALRAIKEQSMLVPEDIRLISLTGHSIGGMLETTMTSLEIPAHEMGKKAVLMAIEEIDAPSDTKPAPQHLVFDPTLVERESS